MCSMRQQDVVIYEAIIRLGIFALEADIDGAPTNFRSRLHFALALLKFSCSVE